MRAVDIDDAIIETARLAREGIERKNREMRAQQLALAWVDIEKERALDDLAVLISRHNVQS